MRREPLSAAMPCGYRAEPIIHAQCRREAVHGDHRNRVPLRCATILDRRAAGEIREGRGANGRRHLSPRRARRRAGGAARIARRNRGALRRASATRRARRRPDHERGGQPDRGDADQLLRAAGRRLHPGRRRAWAARHLCRAAAGGGDDAARRRGRLQLLRDPAARRIRAFDGLERVRAVQLHRRVRRVVPHGRERGRAARRADGGARLRSPGPARIHRGEAFEGPLEQLQHLGRGDRRVHERGRAGLAVAARASRGAVARAARGRRSAAARRRDVGLRRAARARSGRRSCARRTTSPSRASCSSRR